MKTLILYLKLHTNPLNIILLYCLSFISTVTFGQSWSGVGTGMDGWVNASTIYNGELVVGGRFTNAGGVPANYIAKWNGTSWTALGTGTDGWVNALTVYNGELIAGGSFANAGGVLVNNIARWDGTTWTDVSGGTNSIVSALTVYNNKLIAGGYFTDAEGVPVNYIGAWDNSGWTTLGTGLGGPQGQVMALDVYGTDLIAAGFFTTAGGNAANHIAKWDGSAWSTLGKGIDWITYSLCNYGNRLVAGGLFDSAGSVAASSIAQWDGSTWSAFGSGIGPTDVGYKYVFALEVYNNSLFAGGMFLTAGGVTANGIAKWDGSKWSDLAGGLFYGGSNAYGVNTLKTYAGQLYAGGLFTSAGATGVAHIARWTEAPLAVNLLNFEATQQTMANVLTWETTTEVANDHFVIERSKEGGVFERVGTVAAQTGTGQTHQYAFTDQFPYATTYYSLVSVDADGREHYYKTIKVTRSDTKILVYPTVFTNDVHIYCPKGFTKANLRVTDMQGRTVTQLTFTTGADYKVNLQYLPKGAYIVSIKNGSIKSSFTIIKQ